MSKKIHKNSLKNLEIMQKARIEVDELRKRARNGGIKSGESRRFKKNMREIFEKKAEDEGWAEEACDVLFKLIKKGNIKAIEFLRDTMGQKPADKIETVEKIKIKKVFITEKMNERANDFIDKFIDN